MNTVKNNDVVLLGGPDAEMVHIKKKLDKHGIENISKDIPWGAGIDVYSDEISTILEEGKTPVSVELTNAGNIDGVVDIDHHGDRSSEPAAIMQIMDRYGMKKRFFDKLIGANDSGYIYLMNELLNSDEFESKLEGKSNEQKEKIKSNLITRVRNLERSAQGITDEQEAIAVKAILDKEEFNNGDLTIVRMSHSKTATVSDRLFGQFKNLLILSEDGEINLSGDGELCKVLADKYDGSWSGGDGLGEKGGNAFWGGYVDQNELEEFVKDYIK